MALTIALDAGHGGSDSGAIYNGREEKDDVLELTKAVGNILSQNGINIIYTRFDDEYETPFKKASDANNAGADYFISLHRNSSEYPNQYSGVESLVYTDSGIRGEIARNINEELAKTGFDNIGVSERKNLVVLRRTRMPAVLVEVGFINTDKDNELFDSEFDNIAKAIADGILSSVVKETASDNVAAESSEISNNSAVSDNDSINHEVRTYTPPTTAPDTVEGSNYEDTEEPLYRIQVGAYMNKENADRMLNSLLIEGFPAFIIYEDNLYKVQVGAFRYLTNAIKMEQRLRRFRYNTYIVYN